MVWHVKKKMEDDVSIEIAYSCEDSEKLDGIVVYDKLHDSFTVKKVSDTFGEHGANRAIGLLWGLIGTNKLSEKPYRLCTG